MNAEKFGLLPRDLEEIISILSAFPEVESASIFGSRAKGSYRQGSDMDIALYGDGVGLHTVSKIHALLEEESLMPYLFDIVDYSHLQHHALKEHIQRVGCTIYQKNT